MLREGSFRPYMRLEQDENRGEPILKTGISSGIGQNSRSRRSGIKDLWISSKYLSHQIYKDDGIMRDRNSLGEDECGSPDEYDWNELNDKIWSFSPDPISSQEEFRLQDWCYKSPTEREYLKYEPEHGVEDEKNYEIPIQRVQHPAERIQVKEDQYDHQTQSEQNPNLKFIPEERVRPDMNMNPSSGSVKPQYESVPIVPRVKVGVSKIDLVKDIEECDTETERRLHVSNISFKYTELDLINLFSPYGRVSDAEIIYNDKGSKGFGFITMSTKEEADEARLNLNLKQVEGRVVEVNPATKRILTKPRIKLSPIPRYSNAVVTWRRGYRTMSEQDQSEAQKDTDGESFDIRNALCVRRFNVNQPSDMSRLDQIGQMRRTDQSVSYQTRRTYQPESNPTLPIQRRYQPSQIQNKNRAETSWSEKPNYQDSYRQMNTTAEVSRLVQRSAPTPDQTPDFLREAFSVEEMKVRAEYIIMSAEVQLKKLREQATSNTRNSPHTSWNPPPRTSSKIGSGRFFV